MKRLAFKMKLLPGCEEEYRKRHDAIWSELEELLRSKGIREYSIFLDAETNALFGVLSIENEENMTELPQHPVMQKWWRYMSDIMETHPDDSPVSIPLREMFYLP